jgi:transposase
VVQISAMSHADTARSEPDAAPPDAEMVDGLREKIRRLEGIILGLETLIGQLKKTNDELRTLKFGKRSEKLPPGQLALGFEDIDLTQAALEAQIERLEDEKQALIGGKPRRHREPDEARASLPAHLPIVEEVRQPDTLECPRCHEALHRIGETNSDRLDIVPVQYFIRRTVRPKYACRACEGQIVQAQAPAHVVEGGLPSEALVAQVLVAKHADHVPIYTQVQAMARQGIRINRNVVTGWAGRGAGELVPIWRRMREILLSGSHLFIDETEVRVLDPGRLEIDSNTVERALRPLCLTRKNSLFAGNDGGAEKWAVTTSIVETCKMLGMNSHAYITDVLTKIVQGWPNSRIDELMPWAWQPPAVEVKAAA